VRAGNAGIDELAEPVAIDVTDIPAIVAFATEQRVDLVVPGPELPLTLGVVDALRDAGIRAFGPSKAAAQLEGSKTFTKELMRRAKVPTGFFSSFTDPDEALRYVHEVGAPIVVKADGLAAGKGVLICATVTEAENAINEIMRWRTFGEAGDRLVVEEFLDGEEVSFMALTDGETVLPLASSAGSQARVRRRHRPEHRRHGRVFAGAGADAGAARPHHARDHGAGGGGARRAQDRLHRRALRRPDDHRRRAQGARVQLPLRRSRVPGPPAALHRRSGRGDGRDRARPVGRGRGSTGIRGRRCASCSPPRGIRATTSAAR
jgi:hypothetical protein